jgi:hypothetical protein
LKKLDISNFTGDKTFMLSHIFLGLDNLEEIKAPLSFMEIAKIYENEIEFDNIIYSDNTSLKTYRRNVVDIFSNSVKIIEIDAITNNVGKCFFF